LSQAESIDPSIIRNRRQFANTEISNGSDKCLRNAAKAKPSNRYHLPVLRDIFKRCFGVGIELIHEKPHSK
jgi:hypothetical protein